MMASSTISRNAAARFALLLCLTVGSQAVQSLNVGQPSKPLPSTRRVEVEAAGTVHSSEHEQLPLGHAAFAVDAAGTVSQSLAADSAANAMRKTMASTVVPDGLDTADLCGSTCKDLVANGVPCSATWVPQCDQGPDGFAAGSTLYSICPHTCPAESAEEAASLVWLWVLLGVGGLLALSTFAMFYLPKIKGGADGGWVYEEEEGEEEDEGADVSQSQVYDEASQSMMEDEGASQSMMEDEGADGSQSFDEGASQSMLQTDVMDEQPTANMQTAMLPSMDSSDSL